MINSALNISKIISGISSILDYYKRITPIYNDIKPIINKLTKLKQRVTETNIKNKVNVKEKKEIKKVVQNTTSPQFFL